MTSHRALWAAGAIVVAAMGGCVNQGQYDSLYKTNRSLEERNVMLGQELEAEQNTSNLLRDRVASSDDAVSEARDRNTDLQGQILRLRENYRTLTEKLNSVAVAPLDPITDDALRRLALSHSDIMRYDSARGMIQLTSDLTFALGSTEVTSSARAALNKIAQILISPQASKYDARIVGHTDSVPISRPETRRNHPTNLHLSAHRAIAVRAVLAKAGVPNNRLEAAGWGEYRPIVPNVQKKGAAANRRVEIFLVPSTAGLVVITDSPTQPELPVQEANVQQEPLK